jgi:tRNA threonylcarbamoyladenosine biosynthesis protein TsaE
MEKREYLVCSMEDLSKVAGEIIPLLDHYPVVAFKGPMGSGKTTLIKEICKQLEVKDIVTSPTFTLVNEYVTSTGRPIYHFDLYRIDKVEELYDLGYEEYLFGGNCCFIEWPELAENILLPDTLYVNIALNEKKQRHIQINIPELKESKTLSE